MTPNLGLPQIAETQAQPHVTVNEALELIDATAPQIAASASRKTPPANPADGVAYYHRVARAAQRGLDGSVPRPVPAGQSIKGVSTLLDRNGNVAAQWVGCAADC